MIQPIKTLRTGLWHFRKGGFAQVREWRKRRHLQRDLPLSGGRVDAVSVDADGWFLPENVPPYIPNDRPKAFGDLRVAVILDEFSMGAWSGEFDVLALTPAAWREELAGEVDLLFVESAWNGNGGAWQYQLTGSKAPSAALRELVAHCRERNIPTVFWNKEDPPHFDDFLDTAALFDVVFTSDVNKVESYRAALEHDRVAPLSFAAQPSIHNPIRIPGLHQRGDVAFAGMYFAHKYPERREQMQLLLGAAEAIERRLDSPLKVYSRFADNKQYAFPAPFDKAVVGALDYDRMLTAYRAYKVFLNVNSVVDSPSMCARRVFEIVASGTPVVSTRSAAIPEFFPQDEVPVVDDQLSAQWQIRALVNSPQLRDRMVHRAQRRIWLEHTYSHRAATILDAAGIEYSSDPLRLPSVTAMVSTNRPHMVDHALQQVANQRDVQVQFALLTHGFTVDHAELRAKAADLGVANVVIVEGRDEWKLGDCLNELVRVADGEVLAKFDDDDYYGGAYLLDQLLALRVTGADMVGKQASYVHLGNTDTVVLRNPEREHRWTTFVAGPTLTAPAELFRAHPFEPRTKGEDTALLRAITDAGARVYSADRFNFMQVRRRTNDHTWSVDEAEILANGRVESFGHSLDHVTC